MATHNVRADQVRINDRVYNRHAYHPSAAWCHVWRIDTEPHEVRLYTGMLRTCPTIHYFHPAEGVAVQREEECTP